MRPLIIAIHGIYTGQTSASWPDKFDGYCERHDLAVSVRKKEYSAGFWSRKNLGWTNPRLARGLEAETLELLTNHALGTVSDRPIHFLSHSNGTDIALRTIKLLAERNIITDTFIAIGSVLKPDIEKNGIADLLDDGRLRKAVAYCSTRDRAIGFASWFPGPYSGLGVKGWQVGGQAYESPSVRTHWRNEFGHGTWFEPAHIEQTFKTALHDFGINDRTRNVSDEITA
jgi:hypothetical protein